MFPIDKFSSVKAELVSFVIAPEERLRRYKSASSKSPLYRFTLTSPPLDFREAMAVDAVLDSYHGNLTNFQLKNPIPQQKQNTGLFLQQHASKGDETISIGGFAASEQDAVIAGDFISINGNTKGYRVCFDADANSAGIAEVTLTQTLLQDHLSPSTIKYGEEVVFQVCMEDRDSADITAEQSKFVVHDVELIEQL